MSKWVNVVRYSNLKSSEVIWKHGTGIIVVRVGEVYNSQDVIHPSDLETNTVDLPN